MDSLITAAARALAAGDPLGALNRVAFSLSQVSKVVVEAARENFGYRAGIMRPRKI